MPKTNIGKFFEDYKIGMLLKHAVPRTLTVGDSAVYKALYSSRFAIYSSDRFALDCGLGSSPIEELLVFHIIFGKSVSDISYNAIANLGYANCRFLKTVYPGDTLTAESEVIGLKENSNLNSGILYVRTRGTNQEGETVLDFIRWVMIKKRSNESKLDDPVIPAIKENVSPEELIVPAGLKFDKNYDFLAAGENFTSRDYVVGELIDHFDAITVDESEHLAATRLWQNNAKVHFDTTIRRDGKRLVYGGHVISMVRSMSFNGLANAQMVVGVNSGSHVNPTFAGDTIKCWSQILGIFETKVQGVALLRLRSVAYKGEQEIGKVFDARGHYFPNILLDLDYWVLIPS
ncbi:MAG: MaoC family dehydratase [Pseudomonadota bacterium]|nr:MaoC family dehydratase [Pseudomonadota bacterium]